MTHTSTPSRVPPIFGVVSCDKAIENIVIKELK